MPQPEPPDGLPLLRHALGFDDNGSPRRDQTPRNNFCAGLGSDDHATCERLTALGLMRLGPLINEGRDRYYYVTEEGRSVVEAHRPPAPVLTRSQQRYRAFLSADSGLTFGEWLRWSTTTAEGARQ